MPCNAPLLSLLEPAKDLLAYDGTRFQVLSFPEKPVFESSPPLRTQAQLDSLDPATVRQTIGSCRDAFDCADASKFRENPGALELLGYSPKSS